MEDRSGDDSDRAGDEEDAYHAPAVKTTSKQHPSKTVSKARGLPQAKRPRVTKVQGVKPAKVIKKGKKVKEGDDAYDAVQVAKTTRIAADNPLFSMSL